MINANNRITPTNMINQRNKLMTYFLPRGGRFLAALCAGFSVQRRNQMLLSALLLLSSFALLPDVFAQTVYLSYSVTTDDGYVVSFYESESKYHIGINGATEDTRTNLAIANNYFISVNQDGRGVYQNTYEQPADSCDVSLIECGSELRNPDKSFITSGSGYPGFEPTRPFTVEITITPSEFFSSDGLQRVKALVTFPTPTLPSQITDLAATAGNGAVDLNWTAPNLNGGTFAHYTITYGDKTTLLTTPHSTASTTISNLNNGEEYTFTIITHRSAGSSLQSNAVTVTLPTVPPSQITDLAATAGAGTVTLTWTEPNLNGGTFVSYYIYNGDGDIIKTISNYSPTSTTIDFPNVAPQSFSIRTETSVGLGSRSNTVTATPLAPFVKVGNDVYKLTFGPPSTTGETSSFTLYALPGTTERSSLQAGYTASMFLIQDGEIKYTKDTTYGAKNPCRGGRDRSCNTGPAFLINNVNSNVNPSQDLTIKIEITKAGDIGNDVVKTSIVLSSYLIENSLFSIPNSQITDFTATAGVGEITLTWTAPELNGGTFENYTITYGGETKKITSHSTTSTTIPDLNNGEEYTFTISATTNLGTSTLSDGITATPIAPLIPDTTPPVIELTDGDVSLEVGDTYTEPGFTVTDNVDVDAEITGRIDIGGDTVDTNRAGIYTITYDVDDLAGNPAPQQTRTVTIAPATPRANAGADQSVAPGVNVTLSGSGTDVKDDAAGTALTYAWELTSGTPAPSLSGANTATARFTAATAVTSTVTYVFTLTVTDSDDNSGTDTVTVTISVTSEVAITKDIDKQNKVVLPSLGRAIAYQNINAISTRISQVGGANRKNSLGGNTNAVDILKSIERLNKDSSLSAKEALGNSRFAVALDGIGGALWGKIDYQKFKGTDQNVKYDGSLFSSTLGVEGQINDRARLGLALSHTKSDIDYTDSAPIISATSGGDYEIVMLSVNPYISWKPSDDVDLWATLGYGQGDLELILTDSDRLRSSDLRQKTAAVGGSGVVFDNGAIELRLKGEALKTRLEVDKSAGIAALALDAARLRVGLEGSHALSLEGGASLNSSVELGVRYDSGDGQTGSRGEVGGGLEYSNGRGLTLQGNARVLVGGGTYDEWGLGGLLKFQPSTDGRGISFNLGLGQGSTVSKTEDIWKNALTNKSKSTATHSTASIKLGYGITAPYWLGGSAYGILTPYTEVKLGNSNSYDLGLDWRIDPSIGFKLNVKNQSDSVNSINLEGEIRF